MSSSSSASETRNNTSTVFVQVPPSPFDLDRYQSLSARHHVPASGKRLKENTVPPPCAPRAHMLLQSASSSISSSTSSLSSVAPKRKLADREEADIAPLSTPSSKKVKSTTTAAAPTGTPLKPSQVNSSVRSGVNSSANHNNVCPEYPNGFAYCHQCGKKRDVEATIQCTFTESRHMVKSKTVREWRCVAKYCKPCLQNRYGEDLDVIRCNKKRESGHVDNAGYYFKCPKCNGSCNCPRCRKSKGLEAIGTMKNATSADKMSASASTKSESKASTKKKKNEIQESASAPAQPKKRTAQAKPKPKPRLLPAVKWTRIAPALSKDDVEERMHIREFALRFNVQSEAGLLKPQMEELEQVNGKYSGQEGQDPTAWVSDACAKALVLMLLGLLTGDEAHIYSHASETALVELRNAGFSLNRVWSILLEWQESVAQTSQDEDFEIAEPLPPSEAFIAHARRSTRTMASTATSGGVVIYSSAQLIPPILSLIDLALELPSIHDAIDDGAKDAREVHRKAKEGVRVEGERWEAVRKAHEKAPKNKESKLAFQAAKALHKDILAALEKCSDVTQCESMTRFAPLGKDPEGHVFYALAPGNSEREAAVEYAELMSSGDVVLSGKPVKMKRKARVLRPTEQEDMHDWSWMILVWGKKPPSAYCPIGEDDDDDDVDMEEEAGEETERWWAFSDPSDIRDLADWVALAYDLEVEGGGADGGVDVGQLTQAQVALKGMVGSLREFAGLLEWRLKEDRYVLPGVLTKGK